MNKSTQPQKIKSYTIPDEPVIMNPDIVNVVFCFCKFQITPIYKEPKIEDMSKAKLTDQMRDFLLERMEPDQMTDELMAYWTVDLHGGLNSDENDDVSDAVTQEGEEAEAEQATAQ